LKKTLEVDLNNRESQLQNEILAIQDDIEILLHLVKRREEELLDVRQQLSTNNSHKSNAAA
jgi:hypothetical protein